MHVRCTGRSKNTASKDDLCFKCQTTIEFIALNKVSKCISRTCVQATGGTGDHVDHSFFVSKKNGGKTEDFQKFTLQKNS